MANKLSFSVAVSVLFDNLNKIANSVKTLFKGMQTDVGKFANSLGTMVREWDRVAMEMLTKKKANETQLTATTAQRVAAEKALEDARLLHSIATGERKLAAAEQVAYREVLLAKAVVAEDKAILAVQASNSAARVSTATRAMNALKVGAGKLMVSLKTMWASFAPGLIISGIMTVINHFRDLHEESKRIKNIFSDYKKEIDNIAISIESIRLQSLLNVATDIKNTVEERSMAWQELAKQMDITRKKGETELEYQQRINNAVKDRKELLKEEDRIELLAQKKAEATEKLLDFQKKSNTKGVGLEATNYVLSKLEEQPSKIPLKGDAFDSRDLEDYLLNSKNGNMPSSEENNQLWQVYRDSSAQLETAINEALKLQPQTDAITSAGNSPSSSRLDEAENRYWQARLEYANQLDAGVRSQEEYNKAIDQLNMDTIKEMGGILGRKADENNTFREAYLGTLNPLHREPSPRDKQLQEIETNYAADLSKLDNQLAAGSLSQEKYNNELQNLINNTISLAASLLGGDAVANDFFSKLLAQRMDIALPERQKRDTTFDYRKTNLEINREELDIAEKYLNDFKSAIDEGAQYTQEQLNTALGKVTSLKDAIKIAEVKEDIKNLERQLGEGFYSGMKNMVSDADRIGNAFSNLRDVLNDVEASEWERIMAVWNAFTASMDAYFSIIKVVEQLTEVTKQFSRAKQTEAIIDSQVTGQKVANASIEMSTDLAAAGVKKATATQELAADTATAAGSAGKSAAGLPFPFNLIAVAAAIGGVIALFASIPKFAYGGIVGGNSFAGDHILARLNSGEMVLNQGQQSRLFSMLNSGESATRKPEREKVEFKIEGTTLMGVLHNTNKRLSKFK